MNANLFFAKKKLDLISKMHCTILLAKTQASIELIRNPFQKAMTLTCPEGYKRLYNLSIRENWRRHLAFHPLLKTPVIDIHPL